MVVAAPVVAAAGRAAVAWVGRVDPVDRAAACKVDPADPAARVAPADRVAQVDPVVRVDPVDRGVPAARAVQVARVARVDRAPVEEAAPAAQAVAAEAQGPEADPARRKARYKNGAHIKVRPVCFFNPFASGLTPNPRWAGRSIPAIGGGLDENLVKRRQIVCKPAELGLLQRA